MLEADEVSNSRACIRCGKPAKARYGSTGPRPKYCEECTPYGPRSTCRDCGEALHKKPGDRSQLCASCRSSKEPERQNRRNFQRQSERLALRKCEKCDAAFRDTAGRGPVPKLCDACRDMRRSQQQAERHLRWAIKRCSASGRAYLTTEGRKRLAVEMRDRREAEKREQQEAKIAAKPWLAPGLTLAEKVRLRYANDIEFNLKERLRNNARKRRRTKNLEYRMRKGLLGSANVPRIEAFLGYTMAELRRHLERQFIKGMSWDRFISGEIEIDHILPVSGFDLSSDTEVKAAFALPNLRPMWSHANRAKWNHRETLL